MVFKRCNMFFWNCYWRKGMTEASLEGIVVLDLGQIYNGPYATFLMASSGARVIKVESLTGETLRGRGETSSAAYPFAMLNQNKESISLNLKTTEGKQLFLDLVKSADVVLENFSPDTMSNLGLSPALLTEQNPRLIYAAGSGYGREGIHRDYLAMDITVQAMSGIMSCTGTSDMPPMKSGVALCDFFGGVHLFGAIMTALFKRERTGQGAIIDIAMQDTVLPSLATVFGAYYYGGGAVQPRTGNRHPALSMAPYNVYPAIDGFVAIICIRDGHWRSLLEAIGRADLLERVDLQRMSERAEQMDEVDEVVSSWTKGRRKNEVLEHLQAHGVPTSIVRNVEEVLNDEHLHQRGMLRRVEHPVLGDIVLPGSPLTAAEPEVEARLAPELGEHTDKVLSDFLGMPHEEVSRLREQGVVN